MPGGHGRLAASAAVALMLAATDASAAAFTPGNVVVYRVGDGVAAAVSGSAAPVFLDEYTPSGVLVQSIALPTTSVGFHHRLTASAGSGGLTEGLLGLSYDGRVLVVPGYDAGVGELNLAATSSLAIPRVIGRVDGSGVVDTITGLGAIPSGPIRSATSTDGLNIWAAGAAGVRWVPYGASGSTQVSTTITNLRAVGIPSGGGTPMITQLHVSTGTSTPGLYRVGGNAPPVTDVTMTLALPVSSPNAFVFYDLNPGEPGPDTLYVADDAAGVVRYSRTSGTWTASATLGPPARGLTGTLVGNDPVLYATSPTQLRRLVDSNAATPSSAGAFLPIATASANTDFRGAAMAPDPDLIFRDGFETGGFHAWWQVSHDNLDLLVIAGAAQAGTPFGMRALVDDTNGIYAEDESPVGENRYRARFYFDPNGFDPGTAQSHYRTRLFIAFEETMRRLLAVVLRYRDGQYAIMGRARRDDNSQANTPFVPITPGPHAIELDWRRSSGPDANDGAFEMWIDGTSVATLTGLDNSVSAVDLVRLGALSVKSGASGTMYWDEFVSRRQGYIGP